METGLLDAVRWGQGGLRLGQGEPSGHLFQEEGAEWRDEDVFQNLLGSGRQKGRLSDEGEQLPATPCLLEAPSLGWRSVP